MGKDISNTAAPSVEVPRLVRLLRSVWDDVGIPPKDALMAFFAGIIVSIPVMALVSMTAWGLCCMTEKPLDDNAMMASVGVLFLAFFIIRAAFYVRDKWRESSKPNSVVSTNSVCPLTPDQPRKDKSNE